MDIIFLRNVLGSKYGAVTDPDFCAVEDGGVEVAVKCTLQFDVGSVVAVVHLFKSMHEQGNKSL